MFTKLTIPVVALLAMVAAAPKAYAATSKFGEDTADNVYVGNVDHGTNGVHPYVCYYHTGSGHADTWIALSAETAGTTTLNADYIINGDASTSTGAADFIWVMTYSTTPSATHCVASSGTWGALGYGSHYLSVYGDNGDDSVYGGLGSGYVAGLAGDDYVASYTSDPSFGGFGGDGADAVFGFNGTSDNINGQAGIDCLQDADNTWTSFDCGTETDYYYSGNTFANMANCETSHGDCSFY